ncbi:TPA: hypothetical protein RQK14_004552 [Vibrio vulnificus]|nr:hypothetical protein [Vibrio vulnificus]
MLNHLKSVGYGVSFFPQLYRMNYQTGLVFFIAGLPAFIACLALQFL